jgi:hypothetical protein
MFELHPSIGIAEEYTDNFNLTPGEGQANFRTSVSPGLTLLINRPFTKGQISYNLQVAHDSSEPEDLKLFHSFLGQVSWQPMPRLTLTVADVLTQGDDAAQADQLSLRRERESFTTNTFSVTSDYLLGNVATRQYYRITTFLQEGDDLTGGDTTTQALGLSASRAFYQTNTASVGYDYLTSDTTNETVSGHEFTGTLARQLTTLRSVGVTGSVAYRTAEDDFGGDSNYSKWSIALFNSFVVPGRWSMQGSLGYSWLVPDTGQSHGLITSATTFTFEFARATATLGIDQGFSETFAAGEDFGVVETRGIHAALNYAFTPALSGRASAFLRENDFTGVAGEERGTERTWGGELSFAARLRRWLMFHLNYNYTDATQSSSGRGGYTENRVRAALDATF